MTKPKTVPLGFTPRDYQMPLFAAMCPVQNPGPERKMKGLLRWHRRAGKDKACWAFMVKAAFAQPGNYFYIFPTKEQARKALWMNVDPMTGETPHDMIPDQCVISKNNQMMTYQLNVAEGKTSTLTVIGLDKNPDSIRGVSCKGAIFSEFAFFEDRESFNILMPALTQANGWVILNSTPNGKNHFYDLWQTSEGNDTWFTSELQTYWPDRNNFTGLKTRDELKQEAIDMGKDQDDIEREYGVSFETSTKGSYYTENLERARQDGRIGDFNHSHSGSVHTFWDLGVDDATAVWFAIVDRSGYKFIDYFEDNGKDLKYYAKMLSEKGYHYGTHYLPHDARQRSIQTGQTTADTFQEILADYRVSDDVHVLDRLPVQDGINQTRILIDHSTFDQVKCGEGLKMLELYTKKYDKKRGIYLKEPKHDENSHCADALRMAALSQDIEMSSYTSGTVSQNINIDFDLF